MGRLEIHVYKKRIFVVLVAQNVILCNRLIGLLKLYKKREQTY